MKISIFGYSNSFYFCLGYTSPYTYDMKSIIQKGKHLKIKKFRFSKVVSRISWCIKLKKKKKNLEVCYTRKSVVLKVDTATLPFFTAEVLDESPSLRLIFILL